MRGQDEKRPEILSQIPGRLRIHLPGWDGSNPERIENQVQEVAGIQSVQANPLTGNVLIRFNPRLASEGAVLEVLQDQSRNESEPAAPGRTVSAESLLRAGARGLLGHAFVDAAWFGVGALGRSAGVPLAVWLGPLHVLMDVVVWSAALSSVRRTRVR